MVPALACLSWITLSIMPAFWRIASATAFHLVSWSGVILSAVFSISMRCSTVSGLLLVAAAAAGGLLLVELCAIAGASEPATSAAPINDPMTSDRGVNEAFMMSPFRREW